MVFPFQSSLSIFLQSLCLMFYCERETFTDCVTKTVLPCESTDILAGHVYGIQGHSVVKENHQEGMFSNGKKNKSELHLRCLKA